MTEQTKPHFRLERQSDKYVCLWLGDHCMAAICTKRPRGKLDAHFLLQACNSLEAGKDLLKACEGLYKIIVDNNLIPDESVGYMKQVKAAIEKGNQHLGIRT